MNNFEQARQTVNQSLARAALLDSEIVALTAKASTPADTDELHRLAKKRLAHHAKVAAAIRYLRQYTKRPVVDTARARALRGDAGALASEVFSVHTAADTLIGRNAIPHRSRQEGGGWSMMPWRDAVEAVAKATWPRFLAKHKLDADMPCPSPSRVADFVDGMTRSRCYGVVTVAADYCNDKAVFSFTREVDASTAAALLGLRHCDWFYEQDPTAEYVPLDAAAFAGARIR